MRLAFVGLLHVLNLPLPPTSRPALLSSHSASFLLRIEVKESSTPADNRNYLTPSGQHIMHSFQNQLENLFGAEYVSSQVRKVEAL